MRKTIAGLFLLALVAGAMPVLAEDIRLTDNSHVNAMIEAFSSSGAAFTVTTMDGRLETIPLANIITITFRGRESRLLLAGTQELRTIDGGRIRGRFVKNTGDVLTMDTFCLGELKLNLDELKGFVSLPQTGRAGRQAEELLDDEATATGEDQYLDHIVDRRGSIYDGVIRHVAAEDLEIDHDAMLKVVPVPTLYLAGGSFAQAARHAAPQAATEVVLRISTRDGSRIDGAVQKIALNRWELRPRWNPDATVSVPAEEITDIQVLNSKRLYLSELTPVKVKESTKLAPPQSYRMDRSCQGDVLSIGRHSYPWGIGVHANSELTFTLGKAFKTFQSGTGIDSQVGKSGSVIFSVLGDGKELYKGPALHGGEDEPREVSVDVTGVQELTLKVEKVGDSDLGDVADWAAAQVLR